MILVQQIWRFRGTIDREPLHVDLQYPTMHRLTDPYPLSGIGDVFIWKVLYVYVARESIIEPDAHAGRLAGTCACVEVLPYLLNKAGFN